MFQVLQEENPVKILRSFSINLHIEHNFQPTFLWRKRPIRCKLWTIYEDATQIISRTILNTSLFHSVYICYCSNLFRPQFMSIFRKLSSLSTYKTCGVLCEKGGFYISVSEHN